MVYYEITKSPGRRCNGCILSSINENEYEIVLKEKETEYDRQQLRIINKKTQQVIFTDSTTLPLYYFQTLKPICSWNQNKFCFSRTSDTIKILSQKEVLLKIL